MANKTSQDVFDVFESTFQDKFEIPESLERQWFKNALAEYELEIGSTGYDSSVDQFPEGCSSAVILTLGLYMKLYYCRREFSRVNKLQNIVGKDLSMTGSGSQKTMTKQELEFEYNNICDKINKQKTSWFS